MRIARTLTATILATMLHGPARGQSPNTEQTPNPPSSEAPVTSTDQIPKPNPNPNPNPNHDQIRNPGQYPDRNSNPDSTQYPDQLNENPNHREVQNSRPGRPGSINYVESQATLERQPLTPESAGVALLDRGQILTTQAGKVEVLLTPGVFLRISDNSEVKMISPDLTNIEVEVNQGRAMVEVTDISKDNTIRIDLAGSNTQLLKNGLYDFDANQSTVRVFKGKAEVLVNNQKVALGNNREVSLNAAGRLKARDFDGREYSDEFYRWSGLRSGYLAEADADTARLYVNGGAGWAGAGWYWSPWYGAYTFIPGNGIFYSPFGWGFYSPFAVYGSPFFYGGYYGGAYGHPHRFGEFHGPYGHGFEPEGGFHTGATFHGNVGGTGFHAAGGGAHH
jgi:FecR protein